MCSKSCNIFKVAFMFEPRWIIEHVLISGNICRKRLSCAGAFSETRNVQTTSCVFVFCVIISKGNLQSPHEWKYLCSVLSEELKGLFKYFSEISYWIEDRIRRCDTLYQWKNYYECE